MRVYAASLPYFFIIPLLGLDLILHKLLYQDLVFPALESPAKPNHLPIFLFTGFAIFSPLALMFMASSAPQTAMECPTDLTLSRVFYNPNSAVHVTEDEDLSVKNWAPYTRQYKFHQEIHNICCEDDIEFYRGLSAPFTMFTGINEADRTARYTIIADPKDLPDTPGWLQICGEVTDIYGDQASSGYLFAEHIYHVE
jgi:hypothetical protein